MHIENASFYSKITNLEFEKNSENNFVKNSH
jgi:hypothetical protein